MRFVDLFLIGYFIVVIAAVIGLWKTGVLQRMSPIWIVVSVLAAIGIGLMVAVKSGRPSATIEK